MLAKYGSWVRVAKNLWASFRTNLKDEGQADKIWAIKVKKSSFLELSNQVNKVDHSKLPRLSLVVYRSLEQLQLLFSLILLNFSQTPLEYQNERSYPTPIFPNKLLSPPRLRIPWSRFYRADICTYYETD